ncbi:interleukin-23 receptor [Engraulis encrasicolus]|uniref:interleukin-23 receptor n=1 Tax=Engraulis encrasicolus TaxID=184585 RepID=UPI002FCE9ABA
MEVWLPTWAALLILCASSIMHCVGCIDLSCEGRLTVDPGPVVERGSSIGVLCQINVCNAGPRNPFTVKHNGHALTLQWSNCSAASFHISHLRRLRSSLVCSVGSHVVCGLDLESGYKPAKATNFSCFTQTRSTTVNCSWEKGRETHRPTSYSVVFNSVNGEQLFNCQKPSCSSITIPRAELNDSIEYQVHLKAVNDLGDSISDLFTFSLGDAVIPDTPSLTGVNFSHAGGSLFLLTWTTSDSSPCAWHTVRLNRDSWSWEVSTTLRNGCSVTVEGLRPMTSYRVDLKVCTHQAPKPKCSLWSEPVEAVTPGIAPSQKPDAWRAVGKEQYGFWNVTVFWKPMASKDFHPLHYEVSYWQHGKRTHKLCLVNVSAVQLELPSLVKQLNLTLVTSEGRSPPASLSLTHTDITAPVLTVSKSKEDTLHLSWSVETQSEAAGFLLGYVLQWRCHDSQMQWERLSRDRNSTYITGLTPGCRYDLLLHAETTRGLSKPAFAHAYSLEIKPQSGPKAFIETSDSKHITVQWEELKTEHQRGFITHYTIYIRKHGMANFKRQFEVDASSPRRQQLEPMDTGFDVSVAAWNSAGEGPRGDHVTYLQPRSLSDDVFVVMWVVAAVPLVLIANLICLKCARKRMKAVCSTLGPAWLFEKFPKVGNSNAVKLLQDERCGSTSFWMSVCSDSDPPISPVEDISEPIATQTFSFPPSIKENAETCLPPEVRIAKADIVDPYKPQWADSCVEDSTLLPEEVQPEETTLEEEEVEEEEERSLWLQRPSSGKDIGLQDVTVGGFKGLGVSGDLLCPLSLVLGQTEWSIGEQGGGGGMRDMDGFSLALLTDRQTELTNGLLSSLKGDIQDSSPVNPYSPQGCWIKVAHNS